MKAGKRWGGKFIEYFQENKIFWKDFKRTRKGTLGEKGRVKTEDGTLLEMGMTVLKSWLMMTRTEKLRLLCWEGEMELK